MDDTNASVTAAIDPAAEAVKTIDSYKELLAMPEGQQIVGAVHVVWIRAADGVDALKIWMNAGGVVDYLGAAAVLSQRGAADQYAVTAKLHRRIAALEEVIYAPGDAQ